MDGSLRSKSRSPECDAKSELTGSAPGNLPAHSPSDPSFQTFALFRFTLGTINTLRKNAHSNVDYAFASLVDERPSD